MLFFLCNDTTTSDIYPYFHTLSLHDSLPIWRAGLARVYSFADNRGAVAEMLSLEREARAAGRGIWRDPFYAMRSAETAGEWLGGFELVRSEEHTSELQSQMRISYAVFCLKKKTNMQHTT